MPTYTPFVPAANGSSSDFTGATAAEVAEAVLRSNSMRERLGLNATAGYRLHGLELGAAVDTKDGLTRVLTILWQALPTLPQELAGKTPPIERRTIYLQHGIDDDMPDQAWTWVLNSQGQLEATPCPAP